MKIALLTLIYLLITSTTVAQEEIEISSSNPINIGEKIIFHSEILNEDRTLNVYLPLGYSPDSAKKYPVIYLLDGSIDEDFVHISGLVQFGSFSWINLIPETIVVGISNVDRKRDFTFPTTIKRDKKDFPTTGGSEKFINFIENELQPLVDKQYKTTSEKTIIGQSLGGLLATEILFSKPHLFDNFIIISPSIWWDDESIMKRTPTNYTASKSIFIAVGKEGKVMERTAKELHESIKQTIKENSQVHFQFFEKQTHGDVLHLAAYAAFEKIFLEKK